MTEALLRAKGDVLILDLAEERIPKLKITFQDQTVIIANHAFFRPIHALLGIERYKNASCKEFRFNALPWETVIKNYTDFVAQITDVNQGYSQENIIIIELYMTNQFIGKQYQIEHYNEENSGFSQTYINDVNCYLKKCYNLLYQLLPHAKRIKLPEGLYSTWFHRWGLNPLHYTSETYEYLADCINYLTGISNKNTCEALYQELKLKNILLTKLLKLQISTAIKEKVKE